MRKALIFFFLLIGANSVGAQTITLGTIAPLSYCVGDTMFVPYQTSGTFASDNYFFVELSDANGSFASFTTIGNSSTLNGSIAVPMNTGGTGFLVRVASSDPFDTSSSNGGNIQVIGKPSPYPMASESGKPWNPVGYFGYIVGIIGEKIFFYDGSSENTGSTYSWQFNEDAIPSSSSANVPSVTYASPGIKTGSLTVANPSGCSKSTSMQYQILDCNPVIPANVHIVTATETGNFDTVWVKPGGNYSPSEQGTSVVFVESGGSVTISEANICCTLWYIKPGASVKITGNAFQSLSIVLTPGTTLSFDLSDGIVIDTFYCPDLTFDYSQIPSSVAENSAPTFSIIQSGDHLFANTEETPAEIRIMNILGAEVLSQHGTGALDVDLSPLPAGVYFALVQSDDAREVRKIAVVH
jgi:PKD repeat protein